MIKPFLPNDLIDLVTKIESNNNNNDTNNSLSMNNTDDLEFDDITLDDELSFDDEMLNDDLEIDDNSDDEIISDELDIDEIEKPKPILMYSSSKVQNEEDIRKSNKNYIILRLGSVYGYSLDTMRINIMPNLFSKIASQNGTIKLFSGGKQIKSLVPLIDVVRCMKFMEGKLVQRF